MDAAILIVLMTAPSADVAEEITTRVVEEGLAACGNIIPGITLIYRWRDAIQKDAEVLVLFKTTRSLAGRLIARIEELHPYDVPEAIALPIEAGLPSYISWVAGNTGRV